MATQDALLDFEGGQHHAVDDLPVIAGDPDKSNMGAVLSSPRWRWLTSIWVLGLIAFVVITGSILLLLSLQQADKEGHKPSLISLAELGAAEPARNAGLACANPAEEANGKDATTALLLSIFLGVFGAHRFYYEYHEVGSIQLLLAILATVSLLALNLATSLMAQEAHDSQPMGFWAGTKILTVKHFAFRTLLVVLVAVASAVAVVAIYAAEIISLAKGDLVPANHCYVPM